MSNPTALEAPVLVFYQSEFHDWMAYEKRFSPHTVTGFGVDLDLFVRYVSQFECLISVLEVGHSHVRAWMVQMMKSGFVAATVQRRVTALNVYFKWLKKRGVIVKNPMVKVVAPKVGKRLPIWVPEKDMEMLFSSVDFGAGFNGFRDRMVLELLYSTGVRRSELEGMKVDDLDFGRYQFRIFGKGSKMRLVPFTRDMGELLQEFLAARAMAFPSTDAKELLLTDRGGFFSGAHIGKTVKKYLSLVTNVERRTPHVLRHTFATHLSENGADIKAIQELLGHASLQSTQIYTHNSFEKLRAAYEQAHPKAKIDD